MGIFTKKNKDKDAVLVDAAFAEQAAAAAHVVEDFAGDDFMIDAAEDAGDSADESAAYADAVAAANDARAATKDAERSEKKAAKAREKAAKYEADAKTAAEQADPEADVDEIMRKYDRESNTRIWTGTPKKIVAALMAVFSVYCILMTLFSTAFGTIFPARIQSAA